MTFQLAVLEGDGIGPEVVGEALRILEWIEDRDPAFEIRQSSFPVGGASIERHGHPLTDETLEAVQNCGAILLGAVGGPRWDDLPVDRRPEKALLTLRRECELFANLRPIRVHSALVDRSPLRPELARRTDFLIVRELTGGLYFSEPRGIEGTGAGRRGFNTLSYRQDEVQRITRVAVDAARKREGRLTSVDKANVLESSRLWRETVEATVPSDRSLNHLYVDNAAMQIIRDPGQFDVIVTGNLFGDILSDAAAQLCGSIGLLPSASLGEGPPYLYEPVHGSAPDIAGRGVANPLAAILSLAMMFRYSLEREDWADRIEAAVGSVLNDGLRTADLADDPEDAASTRETGSAVLESLQRHAD